MDSKIVLSLRRHTEGRTPGRAVMFAVGVRCIVFASDLSPISRSFVYTVGTILWKCLSFSFVFNQRCLLQHQLKWFTKSHWLHIDYYRIE